ncbi:MAG TPA: hypothetical protein DDZ68_02095 [Parvularcula sp.]|nr:hypothetical protein [Parvularcula sp.]HBS31707.1 hypothetical protein [Parvularcula sp.]HBS35995.1 hypothetical protein [Parvularcula sp.]
MQMIVDFTLLAASVAAGIYCFVLSERLKKLNDVRSGFGATVASMSEMLDQTRLTLEQAKRVNQDGEARLRRLVEDAERVAPELERLLDAMSEAAEAAALDIEDARRKALDGVWLEAEAACRAINPSRAPSRPGLAA